MSVRRFAVLVMLYVTADLANPWMPGAFVFDADGSIEATSVHRKGVERPSATLPRIAAGADEPRPLSQVARPERRPAAARLVHGEWLVHRPRLHAQAQELRPPTEDH